MEDNDGEMKWSDVVVQSAGEEEENAETCREGEAKITGDSDPTGGSIMGMDAAIAGA